MPAETRLALAHAYDYDQIDPAMPGPFGRAMAVAIEAAITSELIDAILISGRSLIPGRRSLAEVAAEPLRRSGKIPEEKIIILPTSATTYGGVRDYSRILKENPEIYSPSPIILATEMHWGITDPLLDHFFPGARQSHTYEYFSIEDLLETVDPELLTNFQATPEYKGFARYIANSKGGYESQLRVSPIVEKSGPGAYAKYIAQIMVMGWQVPRWFVH